MRGRKTEIRTDLHSASNLRALACGAASPRKVKRLLALANALDGMSFTAAAIAAGMERQALCDAAKRYNAEGLDGLRAYLFGATQPGTGNAFALIMPEVSTETMQAYLDAFAETITPDEHVLMVLDQAGWHGAKALKIPSCITLEPLPPRSPELNPVERLWLYLKEKFLSHRLLDDYRAIEEAICAAWNRLTAETGRLASLTAYPWIMECVGN